MDKVGEQKIWSYFDEGLKPRTVTNQEVRAGSGHPVTTYFELAKKVAELQFLNREHVLLFRGQNKDHKTVKKNTTLKPSILRLEDRKVPKNSILEKRFETLRTAEEQLVHKYKESRMIGSDRLQRYRIIRWAILQHYEVCGTPLLDVSQSLRISASFASNNNSTKEAFILVLAVPNISGAVTASSEAGIQIIRLSSACPPDAARPHIQEGYLLGEYPEMSDFSQKSHYRYYETDFGRRLIAKFVINPQTFWSSKNYPQASNDALYPTQHRDPLLQITSEIKDILNQGAG